MSERQNDKKKEIYFPEKPEQGMPTEEFMETWMADTEEDDELDWWFDAACLVDDQAESKHLTKKAKKRRLPNKLTIRQALMLLIVENPRYLEITELPAYQDMGRLIERASKMACGALSIPFEENPLISPSEFIDVLETIGWLEHAKGSLLEHWLDSSFPGFRPATPGWQEPYVAKVRKLLEQKCRANREESPFVYIREKSPERLNLLGEIITDMKRDPEHIPHSDKQEIKKEWLHRISEKVGDHTFGHLWTLAKKIGMVDVHGSKSRHSK